MRVYIKRKPFKIPEVNAAQHRSQRKNATFSLPWDSVSSSNGKIVSSLCNFLFPFCSFPRPTLPHWEWRVEEELCEPDATTARLFSRRVRVKKEAVNPEFVGSWEAKGVSRRRSDVGHVMECLVGVTNETAQHSSCLRFCSQSRAWVLVVKLFGHRFWLWMYCWESLRWKRFGCSSTGEPSEVDP